MIDWNNDNSIYVFTGIMTEQDRLDNIITTSAWTRKGTSAVIRYYDTIQHCLQTSKF